MKATDEPVKAPTPSQSGFLSNRESVEPVASQAKAGRASEAGQAAAGETRQHRSARAFIKRHAVLVFFTLVFTLSWGVGAGVQEAGGLTILVGPPSITLAAILVIALAFGRLGLRDLRSRLFRWRVGVRWYAVALLTAPVLWTAILGALSLTSEAFLPNIITAEDKASLLVAGLVVGLFAGFFEELGWTGFATHEVSKRHGLLATGLIVGLPWFLLHLPLFAGTASGAVPQALAVAVTFFWVLAYRVLMVWVYGHTHSVLMAMLMHLPLDVGAFVLLDNPAMVGVPSLIVDLVFGATLWVLVAAVAAANRRELSLVT